MLNLCKTVGLLRSPNPSTLVAGSKASSTVCLPRTMRAAICEGATVWCSSTMRADTTSHRRRDRNQSVPRQVSQEGCLLAGPAGAVMVLVSADDRQLEELVTQLQPGGLLRLRGAGSISLACLSACIRMLHALPGVCFCKCVHVGVCPMGAVTKLCYIAITNRQSRNETVLCVRV